MDDSKIVELYLSRDETAISQTERKYGLKLKRIAYNILNNMASAEECENDTYLEAWNRIPPNEPRSYLFAFLGKITRHLAIDECRKIASQKRQALFCELTLEMEECIPGKGSVEEEIGMELICEQINVFLEGCAPWQRCVFVRRYWCFDSIADISKRYGFSKSKVKTTLYRMRERLREHLEKNGYVL